MDFARLIAPCTLEEFFSNHYEKAFLLNQRGEPGYYNEVLSEADLDLFFSQDLNPVGIKLARDGELIPVEKWTRVIESSVGALITVASVEKIFRYYYEGTTIIINAAEKKIPRLGKACSAIEQETRLLFQANVYITPPGSRGFSMHYDDHDIFTLQVKGSKKWKFYDSGEELPATKRPFRKTPEQILETELHSGDLLYMPRGLVHEAFATAVSTIHVNFSCKPVYGFHLVESLAKLAEDEDVFFRKMIPNALATEDEVRNYKTLFAEKLAALIETHGVETLLKMQDDKFITQQGIDLNGRLKDALALEKLNTNSLVAKRKDVAFGFAKSSEGTMISFGEQAITIPKIIDPVLFLEDRPFKVAGIRGLITDDGRLQLVRRLVEAGFLQIIEN
ncbi:MAG: JmjC domain-containing protein [Mucilaginibacter sp.]